MPNLTTEELLLDPLLETDARDVLAYASHREVARTVTWEMHRSEAESLAYIRRILLQTSLEPGKTFLAWAVRFLDSPRMFGSVSFTELGPTRGQVGFVFHYDYWRRKVTIEALKAVINWVFQRFHRFDRIQGRCFPANINSCELMEKAGMRLEGVNRSMMRVKGKPVDLALYAITRLDWERLRLDGSHLHAGPLDCGDKA